MGSGNLLSLPLEVVQQILERRELSHIDVSNFGKTCSLFLNLITDNNPLWKIKFIQKWPQLVLNDAYNYYTVNNWQEEFQKRLTIGQQTMNLVNSMSAQYFNKEEMSDEDFEMFSKVLLVSGHPLRLQFVIDELMMCIHHENRNSNLTNKYYSEKVLRCLRQISLTEEWNTFKDSPPEEQLLERGAVIVAQWSQPTEEITNESIGMQLDNIAEHVLSQIREEFGDNHPALRISDQQRSSWRERNIADNHYSPYISQQVINATSFVLFKKLGFFGNNDFYYSHDNSYINKVLELRRGIPITLAIVFESVTRRLGVKCEPVTFPGHFLLRWRDTYKENAPTQYFYIDVFNGGTFLDKSRCPEFAHVQGRCPMSDIFRHGAATALQVVERMANNLEVAGRQRSSTNGRAARLRSALELLHLVVPHNLQCIVQLARFYMQNNMDVSPIFRALDYFPESSLREQGQVTWVISALREYHINYTQSTDLELCVKKKATLRHHDGKDIGVKFAVGMVMHHLQFNYTCVIRGWDERCSATEEWISQMNVRTLCRQHQQPFYHVLVADGTERYVAEDNMELEKGDCWVSHCGVGRYFDSFTGSYYVANTELEHCYPEDSTALQRYMALHL